MKKTFYSIIVCCSLLLVSINTFSQNSNNVIKTLLKEYKDAENSTFLFNNRSKIIPLQNLHESKIASVNLGSDYSLAFDSLLKKYAAIKSFDLLDYTIPNHSVNDLSEDLKFYNTIVIQVNQGSLNNSEIIKFISETIRNKKVIITGFGNIKALQKLEGFSVPVIWCAENSSIGAQYAAQLIFGGVAATNQFTKNISSTFRAGSAYTTEKVRLKYITPEQAGLSSNSLDSIDVIAAEAIREKSTPSVVVLVIKDGNVIFNKAYGTHTYEGTRSASINDIYDLASITKVSATTVSAMRLFEQKKLSLDSTLGAYLPRARNTDKQNMLVRDVLLHQSGLAGISFHNKIKPENHSTDSSYNFPVKVADNYFLRRNYFRDIMWPIILTSPVVNAGKYNYTDFSLYVMKEIVEQQSSIPIEEFVQKEFYRPLGMQTAGYNPLTRFPKDQIVPTEVDDTFRKTLVHGYVHDEGAAMLGGVSGHAGLFASATDLGILYQMLLNKGSYGGVQYFTPETVDLFTSKQSLVSRRGLGFDRREISPSSSYPSKYASPETFGHTGFTGTNIWVDPKYNLVYVFLSNRVYPKRTDKLYEINIRQRIFDTIYKAILKP
ncbi:MAG TPA: serine hydrolase [Sphingobacteriaceae bacterium]|nr:serine hydrolase [Sphingobacteriaceae bacterium]